MTLGFILLGFSVVPKTFWQPSPNLGSQPPLPPPSLPVKSGATVLSTGEPVVMGTCLPAGSGLSSLPPWLRPGLQAGPPPGGLGAVRSQLAVGFGDPEELG